MTMRNVLGVAVIVSLLAGAASVGASSTIGNRKDGASPITSKVSQDFRFVASGGGEDVEAHGAVSRARGLGQIKYEFFPRDPVFRGLTPPHLVVVSDGIGFFSIDGTEVARETGRTWIYRDHSVDDLIDAPIAGVADPFALYEAVRGAAHLEARDEEFVRGTLTTHYVGELSDTSAGSETDDERSPDAKSLRVEIWIDGDETTRRLRVTNGEDDPFVVEYFGFGTSVNVEIPHEDAILSNEAYVRAIEHRRQGRQN
jgi:hypothetical protein